MNNQIDEISDDSSDLSEELFRDVDVLSSSEDSEIEDLLDYNRQTSGASIMSMQRDRFASVNALSSR